MIVPEESTAPLPPPGEPMPGPRPPALGGRRLTIRRIMIGIAALAPLLALLRYPIAFGLVATIGLVALFVAWSVRRRDFGRIAGLMCGFPALPLAIMYLQRGLIARKLIRRSTVTVLDGAFGFTDIGVYLCLIAYVGCVSVAAGAASGRSSPGLKRAAWMVIFLMPLSWAGFFAFALWDPFGVLGDVFR